MQVHEKAEMINQYFGIQNPKIDKKKIIRTFCKINYYLFFFYL